MRILRRSIYGQQYSTGTILWLMFNKFPRAIGRSLKNIGLWALLIVVLSVAIVVIFCIDFSGTMEFVRSWWRKSRLRA